MSQTVPNVDIAYIEAIITCPRCGNPGEFQSPEDQTGVHAGSKFMCVACENVFEIYIRRPTRAAELPLEPTTDGTPTPPTSPHHHIVTENGGTAVVYIPIQKAAGS